MPLRAGRAAQGRLRAAAVNLELARAGLTDAVDQARSTGQSWADIAEVLGVTRQAAFKRFGRPSDPRTGKAMAPTMTVSGVVTLTERVFTLLDDGQYESVRALMSANTARTLTREVVLDVWANAIAEVGRLMTCRNTQAELPDGTVLNTGESALGLVIGSTVLECEAGEWVGRLALNGEQQIIGLLVVPSTHVSLPF